MSEESTTPAQAREPPNPGTEGRRQLRRRPILYLGSAALLVLAFFASREWSDGYNIDYGTFEPSRGELAFEQNLLLFILPAIGLAALGVAELAPRVWEIFDLLGSGSLRRGLPIGLAAFALGLTMLVRVGVLRSAPITDDELVYDFEARLLMSGRLYAESLPDDVRPFFDNQFIVNNGRWFGMYFIGQPGILALGSILGVREWVGPFLAALTVLLGIAIARRVGGERVAVVAGVLIATSPFLVFVSATELSESASATCMALFLYAALELECAPRRLGWWVIAAAAVSLGVLVRPQTALIFPLPVTIRLGLLWRRDRLPLYWTGPAAAGAVLALGAAVVLGVNYALTGSAWRTSLMAYFDAGVEWPFSWGLGPMLGVIADGVRQLNFWLFGWPVSLGFLPFFNPGGRTWTLSAVVAAVILWYGLFAVPMIMTVGPVYYTELILPLAVLSASGFEQALLRLRARFGDCVPTRAVLVAPFVGLIAAIIAFVPIQTLSLRRMVAVTRAPYELVEARGLSNALVFVERLPNVWPERDSLPSSCVRPGSWVLFHRNNAPDLSDRVLFVKDLGERNRILMAYLPQRSPYRLGMRGSTIVLSRLAP